MILAHARPFARAEHAVKEMEIASGNNDVAKPKAFRVTRPLSVTTSGVGDIPQGTADVLHDTGDVQPSDRMLEQLDGRNHMRKERGNATPASTTETHKNLLWYVLHQDQSKLTPAYRELYAEYVELVRRKRGITREQLAQQAQVSVDLITALERGIAGEDQMEEEERQRLVRSLGITFERFIALNPQVITELWSPETTTLDSSPLQFSLSSGK